MSASRILLFLGLTLLLPAQYPYLQLPELYFPPWPGGALLELKLESVPNASPDRNRKLVRPQLPPDSPMLKTLSWNLTFDGHPFLIRRAGAETEYVIDTRQDGFYHAFLICEIDSKYYRISNTVDFQAGGIKAATPIPPVKPVTVTMTRTEPPRPPRDVVVTTSVDEKSLLTLKDSYSRSEEWVITCPEIPAGRNWTNLCWLVFRDGKEASRPPVREAQFRPSTSVKGSYEVWLVANTGRELQIISRSVKYRKVR